jgi:hypothetical protein
VVASELDHAHDMLETELGVNQNGDPDTRFVHERVKRAKLLRDRLASILASPLVKFFVK